VASAVRISDEPSSAFAYENEVFASTSDAAWAPGVHITYDEYKLLTMKFVSSSIYQLHICTALNRSRRSRRHIRCLMANY
jgi:hypothetical protein